RHGPTDWNADRRIQGRADRPLSAAGRAAVAAWRLPPPFRDFNVVCSPLRRARETAAALAGAAPVEPDLVEMDWGSWEGRRLADLRAELGPAMAANEDRGLDFRPTGGESPRDVQARLAPWLAAVARRRRPTLAVTHKGVIRAVYALAAGWDMTGKAPHRLANAALHHFRLDGDGHPAIVALNIPLDADREAAP
ncbi:MAG: histidine phosphatase family protein, partial [Hyphomicrobiales bacterium]|nr:histidine phosphatase family protein [Hyphomicrobiales bacterium]